MLVSLRTLKKEIFRGVFSTLSYAYDEVFRADVVNVFQTFTIFEKKALLWLYDILLNMPVIFFLHFYFKTS